MRFLKSLVLQGYKTFASRTEFAFDAGVTAVVGPNGSGKSNIADGLRWVLGEQSYSTLRGKRTEDMIFSGSEQRPRMGMAYVSVVLDNSTGWLPIEFSEVEIGRRAYRSGENEYHLNGNRVRLRDITELLGSSGLSERTYSVIGQGLVDQALSQRPEERRKLFEEAAGITVHQSKREQAAQKLADTSTNLTRARDIISELTPRLRYLKGQARRAQEYQQIRQDLEAQLQVWYGYKWQQGLMTIVAARERAAEAAQAHEELAGHLDSVMEEMKARRAERGHLRERLGDWHRESGQYHREAEGVQRKLAVLAEQVRLWGEQQEELQRELVTLRSAADDGEERLAAARSDQAGAQEAHLQSNARLAEAQRELALRERARREAESRQTAAQEALLAARSRLAEGESRLGQVAAQRAELAQGIETQAKAAQEAVQQGAGFEAELAALESRAREAGAALAEIERQRQAEAQRLAQAQEDERRALERLAAAQRALSRLQDQLDMLGRLRDEGAGLGAGARAVVAAARGGKGEQPPLAGIIGTLGELIETPPNLEKALEAALGGRVQDIVVRKWEHAEAAVDFLKRQQAGRATFLPLDSLRPGRPAEAPTMAGVLGLASELVRFDPEVRPAVELALNHTLIVNDLPTARRLLGRGGGGATLVTLDGEIVRPGGSVTGGAESRNRDGGMLARARQMRELPEQIEAAQREVRARESEVAATRTEQQAARTAADKLRALRNEATEQQGRANGEQNKARLAVERARQTRTWHEDRSKTMAQELAALDGRETGVRKSLDEAQRSLAELESRVEAARHEVVELGPDALAVEVAQRRAEDAMSAGQLESHRRRVGELEGLQRARAAEIAAKEGRVRSLLTQQATAQAEAAQAGQTESGLASRIDALAGQIDPAEARLAELEGEQRQAESREQHLSDEVRHAQMRRSQADLALQRAEDELTHLRGEIEKDLGLVVLTSVDGVGDDEPMEDQPPLPLNGTITRIPVVLKLQDGLEADVRGLRAQLARLGPVNIDALTEYNEVEARYTFLTAQATDLENAVASLQEVIVELDLVMEREFQATFKAVAGQFKDEFVSLFGGGSAKLVLSDPDSPNTTGVEIIARPPGKREQGLALLSGGERALTAAALIFSILKVRPTPFCVLDEVDAALDEANVGRFRDALKSLSSETQFILVTHNRGTIEAADTIYGVSMGTDHTSQTLSLKLQGRDLVPAEKVEA